MVRIRRGVLALCALGSLWLACTTTGGGGGGDGDGDIDSDTDFVDCSDTPVAPGCRCDALEPELCYTGPAGTRDIGICNSGTMQCVEGEWSACMGQHLPSMESQPPNGVDDDCDGFIDDGLCAPVDQCSGNCCQEGEVCYKGQCSDPSGDADTDIDVQCDSEQSNASPCYYYGYGFSCTNATDEVCVNGGTEDCWPSDICDDCCGSNCQPQAARCGGYY